MKEKKKEKEEKEKKSIPNPSQFDGLPVASIMSSGGGGNINSSRL